MGSRSCKGEHQPDHRGARRVGIPPTGSGLSGDLRSARFAREGPGWAGAQHPVYVVMGVTVNGERDIHRDLRRRWC